MGLFEKRKPKLPSYVDVCLDDLLRDPQWTGPIARAGIEPSDCEVVLRLADPTISMGIGALVHPRPAVLFAQGTMLAIAYPTEREVKVVQRATTAAELQTQRWGWFQIMFGPIDNLDGFLLEGREDNLKLDSPEGAAFGRTMSAFLSGSLKPQQVFGTPQSLVSIDLRTEPLIPEFEDHEDALRWELVHATQASLTKLVGKYQECFEKAEHVEKAYGMANAEFVNGARQHELSRANFHEHGVRGEQELIALLGELQEATDAARVTWQDLLRALPGAEHDVLRVGNWCAAHGVDTDVLTSVVVNAIFIHSHYGLTRESFWTENERVAEIMSRPGE